MTKKYRIGEKKKLGVAENLIFSMEDGVPIEKEARDFITEWIMTGPEGKTKAF